MREVFFFSLFAMSMLQNNETTENCKKNLKKTVKNLQHCPSKSDLANSLHYLSARQLGSECCCRNLISWHFSSGWYVLVEVQGAPVTVKLMKGAAGIGFTLEGGKGSIHGDRPLVINRIFKGESACSQRKGTSWEAGYSTVSVNLVNMSTCLTALISGFNFFSFFC